MENSTFNSGNSRPIASEILDVQNSSEKMDVSDIILLVRVLPLGPIAGAAGGALVSEMGRTHTSTSQTHVLQGVDQQRQHAMEAGGATGTLLLGVALLAMKKHFNKKQR